MYRPATTSAVFLARVQSFAAEMQQLPHDAKEGALLEDVARGRYAMTTIQTMREIASRDASFADRFTELFRPECAAPSCVASAFDAETRVNGAANLAQMQYERSKCKATWTAAYDYLAIQAGASLRSMKALLAERTWQ